MIKSAMRVRRTGFLGISCALALLIIAGCGDGSGTAGGRPRASASGKAIYDGKPIPAGYVVFTHKESGTTASCPISEGEYESVSGEGPIIGDNMITVTALDKVDGDPLFGGGKAIEVKVETSGYTGDVSMAAADVSPSAPRTIEDEQ